MVKVNHRKKIHQGRVFELVRENVTLETGVTTDMDIIRHPGASAIVPLTENNAVILIKQYRHALGSAIWEIPAGTLVPSESPLACAKRELIEETGYSAAKWKKLGEITPVPGYSDECIHLYLAQELTIRQQKLDVDEVLEVFAIDFNEAMAMIHREEIQDGKTLSGLFMAFHWLGSTSGGQPFGNGT